VEKRFFFSVGSIILDDIVLYDGQTRMGVLGGGSTHAAMGMRVWADQVGLEATGDPFLAARYGAVSASFTLEQFGALVLIQG
jgi:hypothetical protein